MPSARSFALRLAPVVLAALSTFACGNSGSDASTEASKRAADPGVGDAPAAPGAETPPDTSGAAQRAIQEADIIQQEAGRLYALSKSGSLSIIDVSKPNQLALLGQAYLPGEPFEMYLQGERVVLMMNGAYLPSGQVAPASSQGAAYRAPDVNGGAGVLVLDVRDPTLMQRVGTFSVPGVIADSRLTNDVLYLVTYQNSGCWSCASPQSTLVTSFDLATPTAMKQVDQLAFAAPAGSDGHERSIVFGNGHLWVGGPDGSFNGAIDLVDVTDPKGKLGKGAHIPVAGPILSRWQMSEKDDVLRVVSQPGNAQDRLGQAPQIETFAIWNAGSVQAMAQVPLELPRAESLKAVRFDADRAYAITFQRTDPLFIIDLKDPAKPVQRGELEMPGYVVHLEPRGDRLIGLGVDDGDASGQLNVSLFDVSNMDAPRMLSRVGFGGTGWVQNEQIEALVLPEDQDRLQKAFRIGADGLITVPYSTPTTDACATGGGVQLIDWKQDSLQLQATLPMSGNPRRALVNQNQLVAVSDSNVTSFDITQRSRTLQTADLVIGTCELRSNALPEDDSWASDRRVGRGDDVHGYDDRSAFACSSTRAGGRTSWATVLVLGLLVGTLARRRASRRAA